MVDAKLEDKQSFILGLSLSSHNVATQISRLPLVPLNPFSRVKQVQLLSTKCLVSLIPSGGFCLACTAPPFCTAFLKPTLWTWVIIVALESPHCLHPALFLY